MSLASPAPSDGSGLQEDITMQLDNLKVSTRLGAGFGLVLLLTGGLLAVGLRPAGRRRRLQPRSERRRLIPRRRRGGAGRFIAGQLRAPPWNCPSRATPPRRPPRAGNWRWATRT